MARRKLHIKKDDTVLVLSGQDRGKQGVVLEVFPQKQRAIVEGIHIVTRHLRPNQMGARGSGRTRRYYSRFQPQKG